jgi:hypothetical protein
MLKKIVLISLFIGMTGILVVGAVGRTLDMTEHTAEARGYFNGNDHTDVGKYAEGESGANDEADEYETSGLGQGRSGYSSQSEMGSIAAERKYPNYDGAPPEELLLREGTVVLAPEDGVDLVIEMSDGKKNDCRHRAYVHGLTGLHPPGWRAGTGAGLLGGPRVQGCPGNVPGRGQNHHLAR